MKITGVKKTKKVFKAKKIITKSDARTLSPLTMFWENQMKKERESDNWIVLLFGVFLGFVIGIISHLGR